MNLFDNVRKIAISCTFSFVNIGKFRLPYFREFATDFPETSQDN